MLCLFEGNDCVVIWHGGFWGMCLVGLLQWVVVLMMVFHSVDRWGRVSFGEGGVVTTITL